jgi:hypothetical protein
MSRKILRRAVAAVSSLAVAATIALTLPTSADALVASRAYGGSAYGSSGKFGNVVNLGRTANQPFCTTASNVSRSNNTAKVTLDKLGTIGAQVTKVQSVKTSTAQSSITTSTTAGTNLLNGAVQFTAIEAKATVTLNSSGYTQKGQTTFVGLKVGGVTIPDVTPAPNTEIPLVGLGKLILNQQGTLNKFGLRSQGVNGLRLILNSGNSAGLPAGELVISYALASLHSPTYRRAYGVAYATKIQVGDVVQSGASAAVNLPCGGSSGVTRTNNLVGVNLPGVLTGGAGTTTAKSTDDATSTTATTTAQIADVNLLGDVVTADGIKAVSSTTKKGTTYSRSSAGTGILNLRINGQPVNANLAPNTKLNIAGVGTLHVRKSTWSSTGLEVIALQLVVSTAQPGLPVGAVVNLGYAQSGVA